MELISFDRRPPRPSPRELAGITLAPRDLVIAVKNDCDGCRALLDDDLAGRTGRRVLFVATGEVDSHPEVLVDPDFLNAAEVRWPPLALLLDGDPLHIVAECVPFGPEHLVASLNL